MDGEAVKQILDRAEGPTEIGGYILRPDGWIVDDPASLIKPGPTAKALTVATLSAARDYLVANKDALDLTKIVLHIDGPAIVHVLGPLDARARVREHFLMAKAVDLSEGFIGRYMTIEDFLIGLQTRFADADDRKRVLALLGNVKHETVKTAIDDGVTQTIQARAGVALVSDVAVPNPVLLCAFRSFRDVVQPSALYILRVQQQSNGALPQVGLFEADGGAWRLQAIQRVKEWLAEAVPTVSVLG